MMDKTTFNAIMNTVGVEITDTDSVVNATIQKYASLKLDPAIYPEKREYNYAYAANVQELIENGITEEDLEFIRKNGWCLGNDGFIYKYI